MDAWGVAASSGSTNQSRECREERALRSENALCGREPVRSRVHGVWTMTEDTTSGEQVWAEQEGGVRGSTSNADMSRPNAVALHCSLSPPSFPLIVLVRTQFGPRPGPTSRAQRAVVGASHCVLQHVGAAH